MSKKIWQVAASAAALCVVFTATQAGAAINVQVLSSMPQLVSGGDALVKITGATAAPTVTVGGTDVSAAFKGDAAKGFVGLVTGLKDGDNALVAKAGADTANVTLVNHGINGVLFAGPKQQPFVCETEGLKLGKAKDADCAADTVVEYKYLTKADACLKPGATVACTWTAFDPKAARPADIADTAVGASRVPQIVRIERGVINRAGYVLTMLHDPAAGALPTPDNQTVNKGWNGKLIYAFGGGVQANYHQSLTTGLTASNTGSSIMADHLVQQGYALASGTLNVFGNNNNYITSAETAYKVKERFIKEFGAPVFTIGYGASGGSMQQDLIGNNYPGILDATIPERLYADTMTFLQPLYDCELLTNYNTKNPGALTDAQLTAVSGMATYGYCTSNGTRYPNARPTNCNAAVTDALSNDPAFKGQTARCTFQDNNVQAFGVDPATKNARNPFDNVGIQYGLKALNDGKLTMAQFIDLNSKIGGMDVDGKVVAARQVGDTAALTAAYASGQVNEAGAGYNIIPVLDIRTWIDITTGINTNLGNIDVHNSAHSLILRARMVKSNGNADNMATIITAEGVGRGEGSIIQTIELKYFTYLDKWVTDIQADKRNVPQAQKVRDNRPSEMANACYMDQYSRITDWDTCMKLFPYSGHPRIAAGGPQTDDVFKCQVKPIDVKDYKTAPTADQMTALKAAFPQGVCDYTKPGVGQVPLAGTWLMFQGDAKTISLAAK
jgi:hypothetical protein